MNKQSEADAKEAYETPPGLDGAGESVMKRVRLFLVLLWFCLLVSGAWGGKEDSWAAGERLNRQAAELYQAGRYHEALPLQKRALEIAEKALGPEHPLTATSLNNLAVLYAALGAYGQALPRYQRALQIREKVLGPEHPDTASSLDNLASLQETLGAYDQALPLYQRALEIREKVLGPEHPDTAVSLNNLAGLYQAKGDYEQALSLSQRALRIREKTLGPDHPDTAESLNNLAIQYQTKGLYEQALHICQRALKIRETVLGPGHPDTAVSLNHLAGLHQDLGAYEQALPLYQRALKIREQTLGPGHPETADSLVNLAGLYKNLGAADQALPLYRRALEIDEKTLGPEHPKTAVCFNNLAVLYRAMGEYELALPLYRRALAIREKSLGPEHPDTAESLNNLALLHMVRGEYDQALPRYQRSLKIREQVLGPEHPDTASSLNNLASLYLIRKDYETAAAYFRRGRNLPGLAEIALAQERPGEALRLLQDRNPTWRDLPVNRIQHYTQLGAALAGTGRLGDAALALHQAVEEIEELRRRAPGERAGFFQGGIHGGYVRPYRGLVAALAELSLKQEVMPSALREYGPEAKDAAFYFAESAKARTFLETLAQAARQQTKAEIPGDLQQREKDLLNRLAALDTQWPQAVKGGEEALKEVQARKAALAGELKTLVKELRQKYPAYAALHYPQPLPAAALPLKEKETLLEFAIGEAASFVMVVRRGGVKNLVKIPLSRQELEAKIKAFMDPLSNRRRPHRFPLEQGQELYSLLLAGALGEVKEKDQVIIVPDGILGLVPFEALVIRAGTGLQDSVFVGDRYRLSYYQSAAVLALKRTLKEQRAARPLFALGNPVFSPHDPRLAAVPPGKKATPARSGEQAAFRALAGGKERGLITQGGDQIKEFVYLSLPETEEEVRAIAGLLGVKAAPPDILLNLQANETFFNKSPLGDYRYLHFATHADFPGRVRGVREPFILLGQVGNEGKDNGFLTLSKVLGLHLQAEMVVLSACFTGRGQVMEGEGVVNFSRAFQHAGAQSVVVSLWEVATLEAVEFMTRFYGHLREGKPRAEAMDLARRAIKAKYPQPFFWAVFILHGEG